MGDEMGNGGPGGSASGLAEARAALAGGRWEDAATMLVELADRSELDRSTRAEALEGVGLASYFLEDGRGAVAAHERAFALYREADDPAGAARMALWLSDDHLGLLGSQAVSSGWLERAERIVEGLPGTPEWAWFPVYRGHYVLQVDHDLPRALELAEVGLERAREVDAPEIEVVALALDGLARVLSGEVERGMRTLDEASATAVTRGIENLMSVGWALCYQIQGCDEIRDFPRAAEWCARVLEFCDRWGLRPLFNSCRIRYASILTWQGNWADAEAQVDGLLEGGGSQGTPRSRGVSTRTGLVRLADIRRRQGRLDEAEALFQRAGEHRWAVLGRAGVALDRGELEIAADLAGRVLRMLPRDARAERADALVIHTIASAKCGDTDRAATLLAELGETAQRLATPPMLGAWAHAKGVLAAVQRRPSEALHAFEDALAYYDRGGAPHEAAIVRLELAVVLAALGRAATARGEAERARESFDRLGAAADLARAEGILRGLDGPDPTTADSARGGESYLDTSSTPLTDREIEVLRLVGRGLSNAEIAEELYLSPHTVKRHVSNILGKLDCASRAAAVGEASRHGVL